MKPEDDTLSIGEASELLWISCSRIRQLILESKLEATREGRRYRVSRASVYARIGQ